MHEVLPIQNEIKPKQERKCLIATIGIHPQLQLPEPIASANFEISVVHD
jgi:hypothetical protein